MIFASRTPESMNSDPEARGMFAGKLNLTEIEALAGLGFDYRED